MDKRLKMTYFTDYDALCDDLSAMTEDVPYTSANLANTAAYLYESMEALNWAGFYVREGDDLILSYFQGRPACVRIPYGAGVCGTCLKEDRTLRVPDVHAFDGHIACDSASASEITVPVHDNTGKVVMILDIDSPVHDRFSEEDSVGLERVGRIIEGFINRE